MCHFEPADQFAQFVRHPRQVLRCPLRLAHGRSVLRGLGNSLNVASIGAGAASHFGNIARDFAVVLITNSIGDGGLRLSTGVSAAPELPSLPDASEVASSLETTHASLAQLGRSMFLTKELAGTIAPVPFGCAKGRC